MTDPIAPVKAKVKGGKGKHEGSSLAQSGLVQGSVPPVFQNTTAQRLAMPLTPLRATS